MDKVIELYRNNDEALHDALDRIVVGIHLKKREEGYKTFLLSGCEPGVGTTTVAIELAISMALAGWKTVLIDGDIRKVKQYKRLNDKIEAGLADYLKGRAARDGVIYRTNYELLSYVPSGAADDYFVNLLCSENMDQLVASLKEEYDYVILDMPSINTVIDANILATVADAVVLVTAFQTGSKKMVESAKLQFERLGANIIGIVVNRVNFREYRRYMKNFDYFKNRRYVKRKKR